ncbi:MAG TPA: FAD-dependent oxidoreductase [Polyangiaceae bacterium]|jgi:glycerol-3-phosphate dehydrogenase subunit B|nr:FAD-dependent oxidoreductase [Polyangiaceae bacterium]
MTKRVVVVGSGAAGTAAAISARAAGAEVTLVRGRAGASALGSGALDQEIDDDAKSIVAALELYEVGACTVATSGGVLRKTSGRDLALLDLDQVKGPVLVARVAHVAWDADALAAAFSERDAPKERWAFVARDVGLVLHTDERAMSHVELAARHDDPARLARAAERIQAALEGAAAVLLPPWLGAASPRARELSALVGVPCGEVLAAIDGPAGVRFEHARDRCLQNAHIDTRPGRVNRVSEGKVVLASGEELACDAVVLATGGVLAGGIVYTPGERATFALSYDAPVELGLGGRPLVVPGSVYGVPPESLVWPGGRGLERVGIVAGSRAIHPCGDCVEGRPRTMLEAFASGARAGRRAAG